ncbi:hypothetical protein [Propylenella binzhouense]|uniref:hypothetical protein n=1 Tax=Propylenella binzhouense TaxID=2555902 RepID=UPI00136D75C5|nr:hypothetical protein [Propylenella binzhouense]
MLDPRGRGAEIGEHRPALAVELAQSGFEEPLAGLRVLGRQSDQHRDQPVAGEAQPSVFVGRTGLDDDLMVRGRKPLLTPPASDSIPFA